MPESAGTTRLTVNIGQATHDALKRYAEREGVTITDAVRRMVALGDVIYGATSIDGGSVLIERGDRVERLLLI